MRGTMCRPQRVWHRWLAVVLLFVGITPPVLCQCMSSERWAQTESSLYYIGSAEASLLARDPWKALENLQWANSYLDHTNGFSRHLLWLISFNAVIVYDCLGLREESMRFLLELLHAAPTDRSRSTSDSTGDMQRTTHEKRMAVDCLQTLVMRAPSLEVRESLRALITPSWHQSPCSQKVRKHSPSHWHRENILLCNEDDADRAAGCDGSERNADHTRAREALIDALGHSAAAGLALPDCLPLGIYEAYKAYQAWMEVGKAYCEEEGRG